jgi:uncharacterized membrane protein
LLVFFADHLAHSIQIDHIMRVVERTTLPVIRELPDTDELPAVPPHAVTVPSRASGYVQVVRLQRLLAAASARRLNVRLRPRVGEHVTAGQPLAWIWPASSEAASSAAGSFADELDGAVLIGFERTLEQDPGLGLRQLIDPACKALSPAVNDPYTAIQAIEHLGVLFAELAARPIGPLVVRDEASATAVAVPARTFAEHLALGVGLIRRYGASEPTVVHALLRMLSTVLYACTDDPDRWDAIQAEADLLVTAADRAAVEPADLVIVHAEADALRRALATRRAGAPAHSPAESEPLPATPPPT